MRRTNVKEKSRGKYKERVQGNKIIIERENELKEVGVSIQLDGS
jgi:hypothetical protein